jgi:aminomethyltransferase
MDMAAHPKLRKNVLDKRHKKLGADDSTVWNDMVLPQHYKGDVFDEVVAVRTRAGLFDVSSLKIINVSGPDAEAVLDQLVTANVKAMKPGTSLIGGEVNEDGFLVDDIMIMRDSATEFRISHGTGATPHSLTVVSKGKKVTIEPDKDVHILSLQGPRALEILAEHTPMKLAKLPYFGHEKTKLFGRDVSILRGGYSGERGYEVYCSSKDAGKLWDAILKAGKPFKVRPASWACLDIVRVEAGLLFFPFDMPHDGGTTPWEVSMDWAIDASKKDFRGRKAVLASKGKERTKVAGITIDHSDAIEPGAKIVKDGKEIGTVNSTTYSQYLMLSIALVSLKPEFTALGTTFEVKNNKGKWPARVVQVPFYDPLRVRTHPAGN